MSGGEYDYICYKLAHVADDINDASRHDEEHGELRRKFVIHLHKVAKALHDIEWVDSGDYDTGDEINAILAVLGEAEEEDDSND